MAKFQPGKSKTGGRKKGTPNKITLDLVELLERMGFSPAARLVHVYRKASKEYERAEEIYDAIQDARRERGLKPLAPLDTATYLGIMGKTAAELMAYVYPKRKPVDSKGSDEEGPGMTQIFLNIPANGREAKD